jgi:hypothetical protein
MELTIEELRRSIEVKSDQLNFEDVQHEPLIVKVTAVKPGNKEQPVIIHIEGHLPYKPSKGMRRVLVAAWGSDSSKWVGRYIELYGDPTVKFGKDVVGGIRISKLSDIFKPLEMPLMVARGKRIKYCVDPLPTKAKHDPLPPFRSWLESKGLSEADAQERIGGRTLEEATGEDWKALRQWAKELKPKENEQ